MKDEKWSIESEFRDGRSRVRDSSGKYKSVSNAILEVAPEYEQFHESELAARIGVDEEVVVEHLYHLSKHGLVSGDRGSWMMSSDPETEFPDSHKDEYIF